MKTEPRTDGPLPVALVGAAGRMGRFTKELLADVDDVVLVAEVRRGDDLAAALRASPARVGLDVTVAGEGAAHGRVMLECGVRPVIGTSGVTPEEDAELDALARERGLGGLVVPNFCLGVWLQQQLALEAARYLTSVEIVEEHKATKKDNPSGTALDTRARLAEVLGRSPESIAAHGVRVTGLYSNQTVVFGGGGEVLRIAHETYGNEAFGPGILASLRYAAHATGVARGVGIAFEFERARAGD